MTTLLTEQTKTDAYDEMTDEAIVDLSQKGDTLATEYLIKKYRGLVFKRAKPYFIMGSDRDDIIQEGLIGIYKAIRDFKGAIEDENGNQRNALFYSFADLCISRNIITAVKSATRQKHVPLNSYVSLNKPIYEEDGDKTMVDIVGGTSLTNPEDIYISQELNGDLRTKIQEELSELESLVLLYYLEGKSYKEMEEELDKPFKSIDNALQRVKRKIESVLAESIR